VPRGARPVPYDVFACIVGRSHRHHCFMYHLSPSQEIVELVYPFWVLRNAQETIVIDTGFSPELARARELFDYHDPSAMLDAIGVDPAAVGTVILSHLHWDHFGVPERFPNATFLVQRDDVDYFTGRGTLHPAASIADAPTLARIPALRASGRLRELDGNLALRDDLTLVRVGGHTPGSQITILDRPDGRVVFACDASHLYGNFETRTPTTIIYNYDDYQRGFAAIAQAAHGGVWFAGHDPQILDRLTPVADGVHRLQLP